MSTQTNGVISKIRTGILRYGGAENLNREPGTGKKGEDEFNRCLQVVCQETERQQATLGSDVHKTAGRNLLPVSRIGCGSSEERRMLSRSADLLLYVQCMVVAWTTDAVSDLATAGHKDAPEDELAEGKLMDSQEIGTPRSLRTTTYLYDLRPRFNRPG
ncbi:hypothetical protein D9758_005457 [Tetrapyrgos nigripes]|uniref:Uncharacterized protein n=1 Tax=Tetrapyrgos nigripes TaxID=182062 RepID=A0A8H5GIE9_9AGAR|nr:hypothetical protein D9758_005457 [Tetrapyrgos nigripes]